MTATDQPMKSLADRTLRDWAQAAEENPVLKARVKVLEQALQFIADGYDNHDVNHVDYRVKVYQVALDALGSEADT